MNELRRIKIEWDDGETELWYDVTNRTWHRIVTGTPDAPCFAVTNMTIQDMQAQLTAIQEALVEQYSNYIMKRKEKQVFMFWHINHHPTPIYGVKMEKSKSRCSCGSECMDFYIPQYLMKRWRIHLKKEGFQLECY